MHVVFSANLQLNPILIRQYTQYNYNTRKLSYRKDDRAMRTSRPWMSAHLYRQTIVCKFGRNRTICLREEAIFVHSCQHKTARITWPLTWSWPWAHPGCSLTWRSSCASLVTIRPFAREKKRFGKKFTDGLTDRRTDRQTTDAARLEWA